MCFPSLVDVILDFNEMQRPFLTPCGFYFNTWHVSIRHIPTTPPSDLVMIVQPDTKVSAVQGPIQRYLGLAEGELTDLECRATTLVIVQLILQAFLKLGGEMEIGGPWSWSTNDEALGRRVAPIMYQLGIDWDLVRMPLANAADTAASDEVWVASMTQTLELCNPGTGGLPEGCS